MGPGDVVAERFEIERAAGAGGMGVVYRARDRVTGEAVALKVLQPGSGQELRFAREARVLASLRHPAIVRYVAHGELEPGVQYLAMQWLDGRDLAARLRTPGAEPTLLESLDLVARIAEALGAAHALGVVHRDVKPSNILLPDDDVRRACVIDFGIARGGAHLTATPTLTAGPIGTPGYMSPEQARGEPNLDARTDVFALGSLLFECVTGTRAFQGEHAVAVLAKILLDDPPRPSRVRPALPSAIDDLVLRLLAKDPKARCVDGNEVAALVRSVRERLDDLTAPSGAPRTSELTEVLTGGERHRVSIVLGRARTHADADTLTDPEHRAAGEALRRIVDPFGASLEVLVDGTVIAVVAAAEVATDQAARAARAALALAPHVPGVSVFVATGHVTLGSRAPVGEAVDRAYALARAWDEPDVDEGVRPVRVDDVTAGLLDARFELDRDARGPGAILRRERPSPDARRTLLGKATPCVGRERELSLLMALAREAFEEPIARVAIVSAPAGVGKSRVASELAARASAAHPGLEILVGRGDPARVGAPHALVASALRRAAGIVDGEPDEASARKLHAHVSRVAAPDDASRIADFLGELIGVARDETSVPVRAARLDPRLMADQLRRAFVDLVRAECRAHRVLLVLDDLHFGDRPSLDLVDAALAAAHEAPLLVVGLARPEARELFPGLFAAREVQEVRLGRLVRRSAEALVREVLGDRATPDVVARVVERADGHAFYLEELIRAVAEGRGEAFPETVVAMVEARLEVLELGARRLLRAASVFGDVFWEGGVRTLLGEEHARDAAEWIRVLAEGEYVSRRPDARFAGEREHAFRHGLVREAAYARLTDADRALGHRLAASWLEAHGERNARVLASHHARGDQPARAIPFWGRAAEQAIEADDLAGALECTERGIAQGAEGESRGLLRLVQSEAHRMRGDWPAAEEASREAFALTPPDSPRAAQVAAELAAAHVPRGDLPRVHEAAAALSRIPPTERQTAIFLASVARVATQLWQLADRDTASALLDTTRAIGLAAEIDEPFVRASFARLAAFQALHRGDVASWVRENARCATEFDLAGDRRSACTSRANVGHGLMQLGRYEDAVAMLREAVVEARRLQFEGVAVVVEGNLGLALSGLGQHAEATAIYARVVAAYRAQDNRRSVGLGMARLTLLALEAGEIATARAHAREAYEAFPESSPLRALALAMRARVHLREGEVSSALGAAREAIERLEVTGTLEEGEAHIRLTLAEALLASGEPLAARDAATRAADRLRARAAQIDDAASRESFLTRVPEHAATLALEASLAR